MTSFSSWARAGVAGIALYAAVPVAAQDLRDIPQKTDTSVTGPVAQPKASTKQGGVQGPPAPLDTQLRDSVSDAPVVQPRPQLQVPQAQPQQVTPNQSQPRQVAPTQQPRVNAPQAPRTAPQRQTTAPERNVPAPVLPDETNGTSAANPLDTPMTDGNPSANVANPFPDNATVAPSVALDEENAVQTPTQNDAPIWPWALGGLALLGLGGYFLTRRNAVAEGGIKFGETPWRDELDQGAPMPETNVAKPVARTLPNVKIPQPPGARPAVPAANAAPTPAPTMMPEPEPAKAQVNESGLIVSKMRRPVEPGAGQGVMAEPMQAPPPPAQTAPAPPEARVASDGRIVSGRRASELGGQPPRARRKRASKPLPGDSGMKFGYKVQR